MRVASSPTPKKSWQTRRKRVSVLAEMALRRERVVERLGELREQNSLTQEQAAQRVGVTHRQWQRWEAGESMPYPRNLDLIAQRFGITVGEFFDEDPLPTPGRINDLEVELDDLRDQVRELARLAAKQAEEVAFLRRQLSDGVGAAIRRAQDGPGSEG